MTAAAMCPATQIHRQNCMVHFATRCAERDLDIDAQALAEAICRLAPCWYRPDRARVRLRVLLGGARPVTVVWDARLAVLVTAWPGRAARPCVARAAKEAA